MCAIDSEARLNQVINRLDSYGIKLAVFREPDLDNQITAIATEPLGEQPRKRMSKYKLWRAA